MKNRILALLLAAALCLGIIGAAGLAAQASGYSDVADPATAEAVAVLSGMGIVSGYSDGGYHPGEALTRAQFCKLAVLAEGHGDKVKSSAYRTLFSDVPVSHWASAYVNLAYEEGLVSGYGNGTFGPDEGVTAAQAVTIVLRLLGYSDADVGPFWPEDYMALAADLGLLDEVNAASGQTLTRGDAALLLYALLRQDSAQGQPYVNQLAAGTVEDAVLLEAETDDGTAMVYAASGGISYYERAQDLPEGLVLRRGTLLLNKSGKISGFLPGENAWKTLTPDSVTAGGITASDGKTYSVSGGTTVILGEDKTTFESCWYDLERCTSVSLYYSASGTIDLVVAPEAERYAGQVLTGVYENASPNDKAPSSITLLGITLEVADAAAGLSQFSVGDRMSVVLNGSGEVVSAHKTSEISADQVGILQSLTGGRGTVLLSCGLTASGEISSSSAESLVGSLVRVSAGGSGKLSVSAPAQYTGGGTLNLSAGTLGGLTLADDVVLYDRVKNAGAVEITRDDVHLDTVPAGKIAYVGTNSAGQVSVILLDDVTGNAYDYGVLHLGTESGGSGELAYTNTTVAVENADGTSQSYVSGAVSFGDKTVGGLAHTAAGKVAATVRLTKVGGVARAAFDGTDAVVVDGMRTPVSSGVQVYNAATGAWTALEQAKGFADSFTVYYSGTLGEDAVVRVVFTE